MKKFLTLTLLTASIALASTVFAEQTLVECSTNKVFSDNTCDVCFQDTATSTAGTVDIKDIKIPWKNSEPLLGESAHQTENILPEIITSLTTSINPPTPDTLWKFTNPWTGTPSSFILAAGSDTTFVETNSSAKITVTDKASVTDKTVLIKSSLVYHDRNATTLTEAQDPKTRNTCVLYKITFANTGTNQIVSGEVSANTQSNNTSAQTTTPPADSSSTDPIGDVLNQLNTPDTTTTPTVAGADTANTKTIEIDLPTVVQDTPKLNSAGPMPRATSVQTGPAENIIILVALILSSSIVFVRKKYFQN